MTQKRIANTWLSIIVGLTLLMVLWMVTSKSSDTYTAMNELPTPGRESRPKDGDTQADTIKALQAYAKAAVEKSERLHEYSRTQSKQVDEHNSQLQKLNNENQALQESLQASIQRFNTLESDFLQLKHAVKTNSKERKPSTTQTIQSHDDIPVGFGFDDSKKVGQQAGRANTNLGNWHESLNAQSSETSDKDQGHFTGLLKPSKQFSQRSVPAQNPPKKKETEIIKPIYTLAKDAVLTDAIAMTALIGRIPVNGKTPDPYPVKLFIGRENLLANGHDLPEVEGMIFSGLGIGDWNLSCVSARLYSASYIFADGSIVNHSSEGEPLGYISDPAGIPCVSGKFVTNAPQFLLKRAGLAGLGTAGAAYADAQQQTQTSALTGNTTSTLLGNIDKQVAGETVKSATDEVTQWLLERQKQSFDAVVVKPGVAVAVHLDKELAIDHVEYARKVNYRGQYENLHSSMD